MTKRVAHYRALAMAARRRLLELHERRAAVEAEREAVPRSVPHRGMYLHELTVERVRLDADIAKARRAIRRWTNAAKADAASGYPHTKRTHLKFPDPHRKWSDGIADNWPEIHCSLAIQSPPWWMLTHGRYGIGAYRPFSEMTPTPSAHALGHKPMKLQHIIWADERIQFHSDW